MDLTGRIRKLLPYTTAAVIASMIYAGWTIRSRILAAQDAEARIEARKAQADKQTLDMIGTDLKITTFYSSPVIHAGEQTLLCYGVVNAKSVRIEPEVEKLAPSLSRCFNIAPAKTTEYKLTAEDAQGHSVSQSIVVKVQ